MERFGRLSKGVWLWPMISASMLVGMLAEARTHVKPADADQHLSDCRASIAAIPEEIIGPTGNIWYGSDVTVPAEATKLLQPNTILSRQYVKHEVEPPADPQNTTHPVESHVDSQRVSLLIVHCSDARDLQGHYPHNCYPAQGQDEISQEARTWHLSDMDVAGIEYHFMGKELGEQTVVYNFFVTPAIPGKLVSHPELNGVICQDIGSVYKSGEDYQRRYYGAAEIQLVTTAALTREQRDQAFVDLLTPMQNVIRTLENRNPAATNRAAETGNAAAALLPPLPVLRGRDGVGVLPRSFAQGYSSEAPGHQGEAFGSGGK